MVSDGKAMPSFAFNLAFFWLQFGSSLGHRIDGRLEQTTGAISGLVGAMLNGISLVSVPRGIERSVTIQLILLILSPDNFQSVRPLSMRLRCRGEFRVVILKNPSPRISFFTKALWPEAAPVERNFRQSRPGDLSNGWHEIRKIDQVIAHDVRRDGSGTVDDQRGVRATISGIGFFTLPDLFSKWVA